MRTNFKGWANELDYLADENEREKKAEAAIALYKADEARHLSLRWRLTLLFAGFFIGTLIVYWWLAGALDKLMGGK